MRIPASIKVIGCLGLIFLTLNSCSNNPDKYYKALTREEYQKYIAIDTLLENKKNLITECKSPLPYPVFTTLVKKIGTGNVSYFKLDSDAYLENDSIVIAYASAFKSDESGDMQKDGLWLYAEFYDNENKKGNWFYSISDSGIRFSVDSLPPNYKPENLPTKEGIYLLKNEKIKMISTEQSEEKFSSLKINGFYFIPNTGRLFKRYNINTIQ